MEITDKNGFVSKDYIGTKKDNAQYLSLNKTKKGEIISEIGIFNPLTKKKEIYQIIFNGKSKIYNFNGKGIVRESEFLLEEYYSLDNKEDLLKKLYFESLAYFELVEKGDNNSIKEIFYTINDCIDFLDKIEKGEEEFVI